MFLFHILFVVRYSLGCFQRNIFLVGNLFTISMDMFSFSLLLRLQIRFEVEIYVDITQSVNVWAL